MIVAESRRGRRIVGSLDRGADLLDALRDVCRKHGVRSGEVRAIGTLESVELAAYDPTQRGWSRPRPYAGGLELLGLLGNASERDGALVVVCQATLMRLRDVGVEVVGGRVMRARVFAVEFVIDAFDDVVLRRSLDSATGLPLWRDVLAETAGDRLDAPAPARPEPIAPHAPAAPHPPQAARPGAQLGQAQSPSPSMRPPVATPLNAPPAPIAAAAAEFLPDGRRGTPANPFAERPPESTTWADVMAASAATSTERAQPARPGGAANEAPPPPPSGQAPPAEEEDLEEHTLAAGDILVHPKFGRCSVERIEGGYDYAHVRLRNGRVVRLSLEVLSLRREGTEDGQRVFAAQVD